MVNSKRPNGVVILAVLDVAFGVLTLLAELASAVLRVLPPTRGFVVTGGAYGAVLTVFAAIDFILAYGVWERKRWAWYCSVIVSALGIALAAFGLFVRPRFGQLVSLVIDLVIVYLLMQPQVQQYFASGLPRLRTANMPSTTPSVTQDS